MGEGRTQFFVLKHWPVLLFIAGIQKLDFFPLLKTQWRTGDSEQEISPTLCQLLFECQDVKAVTKLFDRGYYKVSWMKMRFKLDWFVAGYSIAHSLPT